MKFKQHRYIGDPINAVRIFNAKEADELVFLDITASTENRTVPFDLVEKIADEAFMPFTVGGGIRSLDEIRAVLNLGAEKVSINSFAVKKPDFIREAADVFGSSTIVVSIDVKRKLWGGYEVCVQGGKKSTGLNPIAFARDMQDKGAGEILLTAIDRDGTMSGYDVDLVAKVANSVTIPVVACGGMGKLQDLSQVVEEGNASAAVAGSYFVYHGKRNAVLINFPSQDELQEIFDCYQKAA